MKMLLMMAMLLFSLSTFAVPQVISKHATSHVWQPDVEEALANLPEPNLHTLSPWPIKTPGMTPGNIATHVEATGLIEPIFVIGCDEISQEWLKRYAVRLHAIKATGFVVEAPNEASYQRLLALANNLTIIPITGQALVERFHLTHYPVLIGPQFIEQ